MPLPSLTQHPDSPHLKKVKQLLFVVFCSLIFNAFTKTYAEKTKGAVFCQRSERNKKEETVSDMSFEQIVKNMALCGKMNQKKHARFD